MTAKGVSKKVIDHTLKRWPRGSSDDSYWRHWKSWCRTNDKCPTSDDPMTAAECLADFEKDRGFKFIEKLKCAISTFMELLYGHDAASKISTHLVIVSQIAGSRKTKPSKPRYNKDDAWDIGLIPKYWDGQAENASLSVPELGFKEASLWLAVACARVSDITHICRDTMTFPSDQFDEMSGVRFQYWFTKELGRPVRTDFLFIPAYHEEKLCVAAAVKEYITKTADTSRFDHKPRQRPEYKNYDISGAPALLFMSVTNGRIQFPVGADRIGKWMKTIMNRAGVPAKYSAGSSRMASSSMLLDNGQSLEYVLGLGRWSSHQIFNRHYNRSRLAHQGLRNVLHH